MPRHIVAQRAEQLYVAVLVVVGLHALQVQQVLLGRCVDLADALIEFLPAPPGPLQRAPLQQHQRAAQHQHQQRHRRGELQRDRQIQQRQAAQID
jgi:hypothetical protein